MSNEIDYKKFAVLYVDDEEQALKYFRKALDKEFQILTATNVASALEILARDGAKVGIVLTDQCMPGQSGTDLLAKVKVQWPNAVRILTTAYSDIDSAISAVNTGSISKYLTKPVEFPTMRQALKDAMELFLTRVERDALLREKTSSLRRMIVADRVRSFAEMAGGMSHHLRNSMTAISCFLEDAEPAARAPLAAPSATPAPGEQLWALASQEKEYLLQMLHRVQQSVVTPACRFADEMTPEQLIDGAKTAVVSELDSDRIQVQITPGLGKLKTDAALITQMLKTLVVRTARLCQKDAKVTVAAKALVPLWNSTALQITIRGEGAVWTDQDVAAFFTPFAFPQKDPSDLGIALLMAFFVAYHHGGDLLIHNAAPEGPGFELLLPTDPASVVRPELQDHLVEKLFTRFPSNAAA